MKRIQWSAPERAPNLSSVGKPARNDSYADDTRTPVMQPAPRGATHDKLTSKDPPLQRIARFCHALFLLSVTGKQRFKCSGTADVFGLVVPDTGAPQSCIRLSSPCLRRRPPDRRRPPHRARSEEHTS